MHHRLLRRLALAIRLPLLPPTGITASRIKPGQRACAAQYGRQLDHSAWPIDGGVVQRLGWRCVQDKGDGDVRGRFQRWQS